MDIYGSPIRSPNEPQVVPDDGYNSPVHSPYSGIDSVRSPAYSETSSVDSAFDELAQVIPELSKPKSVTCEGRYMPGALDNSPNIYQAASPGSYDSEYEVYSPSNDLMQAIESVSRKKKFPMYQTTTSEWGGFHQEEPPSKRVKNEADISGAYLASLYAKNLESTQNQMLLAPLNEDSGIEVSSYGTPTSTPATTQSSVDPLGNQSLMVDDTALMSRFEVLAQYLESGSAQEDAQQIQPRSMPTGGLDIKVEEPDNVEEECQDISYQPSPLMASQWLASVMPSVVQSLSYSQTSQSSPHSESWGNDAANTRADQLSASVAELCQKVVGSPSGVVFFNIPKQKKEVERPVTETKHSSEVVTPIDPKELVRNWKGAVKTKRPTLVSHSSKPRLYNFLLELLSDSNAKCIEWLDEEQGIFKFMNSNEVARLWGLRKNKPNMKYENFARSLRTYVAKGILTKPRNKLVYQFMPNYH